MKQISWVLMVLGIVTLTNLSSAQTLNWASMQKDERHIANMNIGWDYAYSLGLGYAYLLNTKMPSAFNAQFSLPSGENLTDDFKVKLGYQLRVIKSGSFLITTMANGIFRRYQSDFVTLRNFGAEFTGVAGFFKPGWFAAAEFGFDKAITTQIRNSDLMKQNYPAVQDGWYVPTGGNFFFGIQAGWSVKHLDLYLKAGRTLDQYFKATAMNPNYVQIGANVRF